MPGRKRPILTDTLGLLLAVNVHPARVQDRDGAEALLREARRSFPFIERIIADAGDQGQKREAAVARTGVWELQIVRRGDRHRFVVLPKRWIVERTLAWISRCRRLARDYKRHTRKAAAFVRLAMIRLMLRRLSTNPLSVIQSSQMGSYGGASALVDANRTSPILASIARPCFQTHANGTFGPGSRL